MTEVGDHIIESYIAISTPPLSREEEIEAFKLLRQGDTSQEERILRANVRFAISIMRTFQSSLPLCAGVTIDDMASEAISGMLDAMRRFDEDRGFKFISYAVWWVRQRLQSMIYAGSLVRIPTNQYANKTRVDKAIRTMRQTLDYEPSFSQMIEMLELPAESVDELLRARACFNLTSLDGTPRESGTDGGPYKSSNHDIIEDQSIPWRTWCEDDSANRLIAEAIELTLDAREARIIRLYYGMNETQSPCTLEKIGQLEGLTRERIRQLKDRSLEKLEIWLSTTHLHDELL